MTQSQEDMRKAFEQFMITGKKKKKSVDTVDDVQKNTREKKNDRQTNVKEEAVLKKAEKKYWQILNAFQGTLERDWLEVDDNLEGVVSSISNLRSRIAMESRLLYKMRSKSGRPWDGCGYRVDDSSGGLLVDDVELALSHDLVQHEKMMAGARMLLASLSEAQEALGRRLDELMLHHLDTLYLTQQMTPKTSSSLSIVMSAVEKLQDVFTSLALELYRKQLLIQSLLDAMNDGLLVRDQEEEETDDAGMDVNPRGAAEKCLREWPRGSKASHVHVDMLDGLLMLGERGEKSASGM